jgi:hypothetical protein
MPTHERQVSVAVTRHLGVERPEDQVGGLSSNGWWLKVRG